MSEMGASVLGIEEMSTAVAGAFTPPGQWGEEVPWGLQIPCLAAVLSQIVKSPASLIFYPPEFGAENGR